MSQSRQLAAIMFTDIVGYTAMMQKDEEKAVAVIKHYNTTLEKWVTQFNGQVLNYYGDGSLCIFSSATDAVNCSLAVQKDLKTEPVVPLRIGLHIGEVFFENEKALGDGVNVASRVQSLGQENTILISEEVHNKIKNNASISTASLGHFEFKNVGKSMEVFALTNDGLFVPQRKKMEGKLKKKNARKRNIIAALSLILLFVAAFFIYKKIAANNNTPDITDKSIAVLPFVDMSSGKEQEYFSDGLSEELLNLLSKVPGLKVIARTSSFSFKGKNEDIRSISQKLGVAHILEGSVRRDGNHIRISAQLIKASDGTNLWSGTYDREMVDIFKVQDEVAAAVVKELQLKLVPAAQHGATTSNIEAYNLVLQGNYFFDRLDKENILKSINLYQNAIAIDSTYEKAWAVLARSYSRLAWFNIMDQNEGYEKARSASMKALELNPNSVDGLRALGDVKQYHDFNWNGAEADFKRALEIEPGNAEVLSIYSVWHLIKGDFNKASLFSKEALLRDPLRPLYYIIEGVILGFSGKYQEAIAMNKKVLEINPAAERSYGIIGRYYLFMGKIDDALTAISKEPWDQFREFSLTLYFHAAGRKKEADEALKNFIEKYEKEWAYYIASIYAYRGEKNKAIEWLEKAFERKDTYMVYVKSDPLLKNLQNDSRYISILKKMTLD